MRIKLDPRLSLAFAVALALPFASDGAGECCNATTTLASGINDPVNGDEDFFKLSNGASNVMLLVDSSGSMAHLPRCGDNGWSGTSASSGCGTAQITAPDDPPVSKTVAKILVNGTCLPSTETANLVKSGGIWKTLNATTLAWMESVKPQATYADPGHGIQYAADGTTVLQDDRPPWSTNWPGFDPTGVDSGKYCTGDNCLFDPAAYYLPNEVDDSVTSAKRRAHDTDTSLASACTLIKYDGTSKYVNVQDKTLNNVSLSNGAGDSTDCNWCMANHGFFMFNVKYANSGGGSSNYTYTSSGSKLYFKGTFLNAHPPKAVTARKIVKDLLWIDDANPSKLDQVRLGFAYFKSSTAGGLPVLDPTDSTKTRRLGLVPTKSNSYPAVKDNYKLARLPIMQWVNANGASFAKTATPLAHALLAVGQYYTDPSIWTGWKFATNSEFTVPTTPDGYCSICWDCQKNSVVVITDGSPNEDETTWPTTILTAGDTDYTKYCGTGGVSCTDTNFGGNYPAVFPRVAYFLKNNAIHPGGGSASNLNTYTVGINLPDGDPLNILKAAGNMGTGTDNAGGWQNAYDPDELAKMVFKAVESASDKESSFSAPAVSAFQTAQTSTSQAFVSRFLPNARNNWEGHVFAGKIFDEFINGCDPTKPNSDQPQVECVPGKKVSANFNGNVDADGNASCGEVFLVDQDCKAIQEGGSGGEFFELDYTDPENPTLSSTPAKFAWDGGYLLNYRKMPDGTANSRFRAAGEPSSEDAYGNGDTAAGESARNIFTAVPDGKGGWTRTSFTTANVAKLQPFMAIDDTWCSSLLDDIGYTSTSVPAKPATAALRATECAKAIIYWVRGFDLFDEDGSVTPVDATKQGCGAPGMPTAVNSKPDFTTCKGQDRDREDYKTFWKLGDVFHSSPVAVKPPASEDQCDLAYENQCVATLHGPAALPNQTPLATQKVGGVDHEAYYAYWSSNMERKKVVLVGANDGMLHAFDAGDFDNSLPKDPFGNWQYSDGTGEELWAFIPPDLLPKLRRLVKKSGSMTDHQYMVDGSTMVRDIWYDDDGDGTKQSNEFHTIAIVTERSGGTQYSALDVTDPLKPAVRWAFPRSCSDDAKYMGQSWSDFAPRPPPIGPVKIANSSNKVRGFDELWIAMINGGYDPAMGQGRAVFMVDAWTGETVWRFTDDDFKKQFGYGSGTSMFPVPGAIALVDLGDTTKPNYDADGFFDTATWGDLGGNLFVARFQESGTRDAKTRLVTNWYAARTFEEQRGDKDDKQFVAGRSEFYFMTANAYEGTTRTLRTYLGSGNRERMMQKGAACGTDNLMGCCQAGCAVSSTVKDDYGACDFASTFSCGSDGQMTRSVPTPTAACATDSDAVCGSGKNFSSALDLQVTCPGATLSKVAGSISVDTAGVCSSLSPVGKQDFAAGVTSTLATPPKSRFYGIWSYGKDDAKMFKSDKDVGAFEKNRFTDVALGTATCTGPTDGNCTLVNTTPAVVTYDTKTNAVSSTCSPDPKVKCKADEYDAGWYYEYADNERTGSGATVAVACTAWNSLDPTGSGSSGTDICSGTVGTPATNGYLADYVSGVQSLACGYAKSGNVARSTPRNSTAPPSTSMVRATVNAKGQIEYSTLSLDPGAPPGSKSLGVRSEIAEPVYWLEVGRQLHSCRHVDSSTCK